MRLLKLVILAVVILLSATALFDHAPKNMRHEIADWYARLGAPDFIVALDSFKKRDQAEVLREYRSRGYELQCYDNLRREEKIASDNDYLCSIYVNAIYDNIPARLVTFFFTENTLRQIRFELPSDAFDELQNFLSRKLANYKRLDLQSNYNFGTDNFGKPLMVWAVKEGVVVTSKQQTKGQKVIMMWSSTN